MKKPSLNVSIVSFVGTIFVISVLTYVSVLGENHTIDRMVASYFDKLQSGMYIEACESFSPNAQSAELSNDEQRANFNFLLELSLLKHYNLVDHDDYKVEVKRNHFWIPYLSDDSVRISLALRKEGGKNLFDKVSGDQNNNLIHNLMVVGREKRTWKIKEFNIADTPLSGIYNELRKNIDLDRYVQRTSDGFLVKDAAINIKTLTPIDKRLLRFSLHKIQKILDAPP